MYMQVKTNSPAYLVETCKNIGGGHSMNKDEKIQYANYLIDEITTKFLQKDNPYIIMEGYEYFREVITLYAK